MFGNAIPAKSNSLFMKKLFLGLLLFIAVGYLCRSQTAGFTPSKIDASAFLATPQPLWHTPEQDASPLLGQPFRFLGAGAQTYAFQSEDGKTVLKFIKQSHRKPLPWLAQLQPPLFLSPGASASSKNVGAICTIS